MPDGASILSQGWKSKISMSNSSPSSRAAVLTSSYIAITDVLMLAPISKGTERPASAIAACCSAPNPVVQTRSGVPRATTTGSSAIVADAAL